MSYRDYFDIDPDYFPQVDKRIIDTVPDLWKKFYPHPSFVSLLKATVDVLKRKQKLSIWVDGAYGTGKSHAVLTLKKLIEANADETKTYFEKYNLDTFLYKDLMAQKESGKILVCHRYGSSDINNDVELIVAIQEGIEKALVENGIENQANSSLKRALIRYFENDENKRSFDIFAAGSYRDVLGGDMADDILEKLRTYEDDALRTLITKIFKVSMVKGSFSMNTGELCEWIREVIEKNNLYNLIFIWDEFSEYFENNLHHLTGFQQIAELAATAPFCLMIVTHKAEGYFSDGDPDKKKILDRFVPPVHISLPENIAFALMHEAMKVTEDETLAAKWEKNKGSLDKRTMQSRTAVKNKIGLTDADLSNVLPIHPYAALLLQHISIYYTSTARSMFNFIKNDEGEDVKAFQWFIDNYDFSSQNPFITIDMLWSFFYESGQSKLASGIKEVLNCYTPKLDKDLIEEEKRVLKTILLLQAASDRMTGNRDIFLPNDKNITLAFEGTDLEFPARNIAKKLLNDHVITRTPLTGDVFSYCCKNTGTTVDSTPYIKDAQNKSTKDLSFMTGCDLRNIIEFTPSAPSLEMRYSLAYATLSDFDSEAKKANNPDTVNNKLYAVATIARDDSERVTLQKKIKSFFESNPDTSVVVVDMSNTTLGDAQYGEFVENYAMALAIGNSDITQRKTYEGYATDVLKNWAKRIKSGDFYVYSKYMKEGERVANSTDLISKLMEINKCHYPNCLEAAFPNVVNTMYGANSLVAGATCGITEEMKGTFRSGNEATKLENALKDVWKVADYWKTSRSYIAILKNVVDGIINEVFKDHDRVSIAYIYNILKEEPYGFMPCNLTAFILGFILKEYANGTYSYSDNMTTDTLDTDKLATMIAEIIKQENTPDKRYKDKYIVTLTESERAFNKVTSEAFSIDSKYCVSITDTRSRIREQMKTFSFPIWLVEYDMDDVSFKTSKDVVCSLINNYCAIANNQNDGKGKSDSDIALEIGNICIANPDAVEDLKVVITKDRCKQGMLKYLESYAGGELVSIANAVGDGGQYINHLEYKFSSDAANWVWNKDTVHSKIDELITEYKIIEYSNKILAKNTTYIETIRSWCDKITQIRLAYSVIKNNIDEGKEFYEMLRDLKKANSLLDSQKKKFLELLVANVDNFRTFMSSQAEMFEKSCSHYLDGLSLDDVNAMIEDDQYGFKGSYVSEPDKYYEKVQKAVLTYKSSLEHVKLRNLWKELTRTECPFDWSAKYLMPIMAMVPDQEADMARKAFSTINSGKNDSDLISSAMDYISKMSYVNMLNSKEERDKAFEEVFLKEYEVLFESVDYVKEYLKTHVSEQPYFWLESKDVAAKIKSMATASYMESGYGKAKKIIDDMPADKVKEYLKQLIEDNIVVGVEIIKGNN
ncbi:hypothetical protein [Roseburia inulinivorans]|uniref:Uncharacterized protein n=1 Tax=Roseburia inulinivorans TaxID=360807 RepID=A0A396AF30_9FIRM|nr:hypothetical protein [Roseburia inulinivorans]RHD03185.1 hypothetical protein DW813_09690 [Roseburia inulinivorans]